MGIVISISPNSSRVNSIGFVYFATFGSGRRNSSDRALCKNTQISLMEIQ
ncbi:hypothetical protein CKA32_000430 [Geitlerinema sp. FC II]|nr:hypothetical protein CKA32_000430 [Geitlerinema sp. FC II]